MHTIECLILGFYDFPFPDYVAMIRSMGENSGAYRDLALAFVELEGKPQRALDILTHFFYEGRPSPRRPFNNADFLWPVVTYLTSYLNGRGYSTDYINLPHFEMEKLRTLLEIGAVQTVAITTTLYVSPHPITDLISMIRRYSPRTKLIVGGPYISTLAKTSSRADLTSLLRYLNADIYVLCSEGEATLASILAALRANSNLELIPNIAFFDDKARVVYTLDAPESNSLSANMVDYSLFNHDDIGAFVTTRTAKSCPFACAFCAFPSRAGQYTYLSVSDVQREFDAIDALNTVTTVTIIDDTFNVPKGRFKELLRMMLQRRYKFKWNCFYRADHGDDEAIDLMGQAGCEGVFLGVESGSDAMLARMKKTARRKHYLHAIPRLQAAGISTYASFIVGFPGETEDTVRESIDLIEHARPEFYRAQLWYADPVTPIWKDREQYGIRGEGFRWEHNTMNVQQACEWIETMFLTIDRSTWLPQVGFEQWSTFYLQRKGMTREQITRFLKSFNVVIKHRLVSYQQPPEAELIESLRLSCQFDRAPQVNVATEGRWSGQAYAHACADIAAELSGVTLSAKSYPARVGHGLVLAAAHDIRKDELCGGCDHSRYAPLGEVFLAAYASVLAGVCNDPIVAAAWQGDERNLPIPISFRSSLQDPFTAWLMETSSKTEQLSRHRHCALAIFENTCWRKQNGLANVALRHAFRFIESANWSGMQPEWLKHLSRELEDVLTTVFDGDRIFLKLYTSSREDPLWAEELLYRVIDLLRSFEMNKECSVADLIRKPIMPVIPAAMVDDFET